MVIDVRLRPPFKSFRQQYSPAANKAFSAKFGLASPPSVQQISEELMLREMDEAGITFGLATGRNGHFRYNVSNEDVVEMTAHYGASSEPPGWTAPTSPGPWPTLSSM